jgi:xanthine dehydrogenase small subunit
MPETLHFILNDEEVSTCVPAGTPVLDFLREHRRLTGTKEGCREGDCGACVVLVGELSGERVRYRPVTSCLMPIGELHGKHLVTIEGLNGERLSPVQKAIIEEGASQCGFCTPGIVVSLTHYVMEHSGQLSREGLNEALGGHLCRCTGYRSLKAVLPHIRAQFQDSPETGLFVQKGLLPDYFNEMVYRLDDIPPLDSDEKSGQHVLMAGGTDLYVQQGDTVAQSNVLILNRHTEWSGIREEGEFVAVGALTTFEDFSRSGIIRKLVPEIKKYMAGVASLQIRNRATVGGNIVNASPIGDLTVLLLALRATLVLNSSGSERTLRLSQLYKGYRKLAMTPGEIVIEIQIPLLPERTSINFEKVSKRTYLDIASVNSALQIQLDGPLITDVELSFGGVAPIPLLLDKTRAYLTGATVSVDTILEANSIAQSEIAPIDDIRGSALYKRLLVRQLLLAHFVETRPGYLSVEDFYEKR